MIVLDTNVLSEPLRPSPTHEVVGWLDRQRVDTLFLAVPTLAEIRHGIEVLPSGQRRSRLSERFEDEVLPLFAGRVLDVDEPVSRSYATLQAAVRRRGKALSVMEGLIAAICAHHGSALATRNVRDFEGTGLTLINPWRE